MKMKKYKYQVTYSNNFKKDFKKIKKQGKDLNKLKIIIDKLAKGETLEPKYRNHQLHNDKKYKNCSECHIEPDWLLIYKYLDNEIILLLVGTGSHSKTLNK